MSNHVLVELLANLGINSFADMLIDVFVIMCSGRANISDDQHIGQ